MLFLKIGVRRLVRTLFGVLEPEVRASFGVDRLDDARARRTELLDQG